MRRIAVVSIMLLLGMVIKAQTIDERIGAAMNASDFFCLYDTYHSVPKDSINPFLEVLSRGVIGNRFNRPELSIPAFEELIKDYYGNLDLNLLISCSVMYSMDLSRVGRNEEAYKLLSAVLATAYQMTDSASLSSYAEMAGRYKALSEYSPYRVSVAGDKGVIPFDTVQVGNTKYQPYLMQIMQSKVNGKPARITFDTGATVNIITDSLAKVYGWEFLDANVMARGFGEVTGKYAIARELVLGNITVRDVPFYVIDARTHNEKADKYSWAFQLIVGSELMLQLKDVTLDFEAKEIQVCGNAVRHTNSKPNMCFAPNMHFLGKAEVMGYPMLMVLDSGAAGYGLLNRHFYDSNKEYITFNCRRDTISSAGIGGVSQTLCYELLDSELSIGGTSVKAPSIMVHAGECDSDVNSNNSLGLKSMMLFRKVRFNLVDMVLSTEK